MLLVFQQSDIWLRGGTDVYVTSRIPRKNHKNITYIKCNALVEWDKLQELLKFDFDAIIDFMLYDVGEFQKRVNAYLSSTKQYIFISSCRVFAESKSRLSEESDRLFDVSSDQIYIKSNDYNLVKAREEDILHNCIKSNWTIVRPYITYNTGRLQLGVYEIDYWLSRALRGKAIIFPEDMVSKYTTLTFAGDVAVNIARLVGKDSSHGEIYDIVSSQYATWDSIFHIYDNVLFDKTGHHIQVKFIQNSIPLNAIWNRYTIKYDRLFDRKFNNSKIKKTTGFDKYTSLQDGLKRCLDDTIDNCNVTSNRIYEQWSDSLIDKGTAYIPNRFRNIDVGDIVLWGTGKCFNEHAADVMYISKVRYACDNDSSKWGSRLTEGIVCESPEILLSNKDVFVVIMMESITAAFQVVNQLLDMGISNFDVYGNWITYAYNLVRQ